MKRKLWNVWVLLHWVMAFMVILTFSIGVMSLNGLSGPAQKKLPLEIHLILGISILVLAIARYVIRIVIYKKPLLWHSQKKQPAVLLKNTFILDALDKYVHPLLYIFTILMTLLGIAIAVPADLLHAVFPGGTLQIPADFTVYPARAWHGALSFVLVVLVFQHSLVALFHILIKQDSFLKRMWFKGDRE